MSYSIYLKTDQTLMTEQLFESHEAAYHYLDSHVLPVFKNSYIIVPTDISTDSVAMINEGLQRGDLEALMHPVLSVDEYVPSDIQSDNVVIAIKLIGNSKVVYPVYELFRDFDGVVNAGYSNSSIDENAFLVYLEMVRENFDIGELDYIMEILMHLSGLTIEDFSISLPNTKHPIPYDQETIIKYVRGTIKKDHEKINKDALRKFVDGLERKT